MAELAGQVALVTGGGRGIGASIARELAAAGMRVAVSARTRGQVEAVAGEIGGLAIEADVPDAGAVERLVGEVEGELGPIDLLVANAGIGSQRGSTWEADPEDWWRIIEVNVLGVHPLLSRRHPWDARARLGPHRHHRQRRRLSPGIRTRRIRRARRPSVATARRSRTSLRDRSRSSASAPASCAPR